MHDTTTTTTPTPRRTLGQRIDRMDELLEKKSAVFDEIHALIDKARDGGDIEVVRNVVDRYNMGRAPLGYLISRVEKLLAKRDALGDEVADLFADTIGYEFEVMKEAAFREYLSDQDGGPIHVK
jgi:uncharacterized protein (UPF0335 family)